MYYWKTGMKVHQLEKKLASMVKEMCISAGINTKIITCSELLGQPICFEVMCLRIVFKVSLSIVHLTHLDSMKNPL